MAIKGLIKGLHRYFYTTVIMPKHAAAQTPEEPE